MQVQAVYVQAPHCTCPSTVGAPRAGDTPEHRQCRSPVHIGDCTAHTRSGVCKPRELKGTQRPHTPRALGGNHTASEAYDLP